MINGFEITNEERNILCDVIVKELNDMEAQKGGKELFTLRDKKRYNLLTNIYNTL